MSVNYHQQNVWGHWFLCSGCGSLSCVLIGQNAIFMIFMLSWVFKKSNFSFYYFVLYNASWKDLVFNIKIGCTDLKVSLTWSIQCNETSISLQLIKQSLFHSFQREKCQVFVCLCWSFTAQSTTRSCRAGQLIVHCSWAGLYLLSGPRQWLTTTVGV